MKLAFPTTVLALAIAGILATGPVMADKGGKHDRGDQRDDRHGDGRKSKDDHDRQSPEKNRHFEERQYVVVREYYEAVEKLFSSAHSAVNQTGYQVS